MKNEQLPYGARLDSFLNKNLSENKNLAILDFEGLFPEIKENNFDQIKTHYLGNEDGKEKMITKVIKLLDKYFADLESVKGRDINKINLKTFIIVEKEVHQITNAQLHFKAERFKKRQNKENNNEKNPKFTSENSDSSFEERDCHKMREFEIKCSDFREKNTNFF